MGQQRFEKLMKISKFPWVLSNVDDIRTSKPFVNAHNKVIVDVGEIRVRED
jgi:2',3'-cyclic-nucleotide 2'-phosphodiesterase (5'-nucleotidase family)